jgi:5-methyltetrahydrofolate--homocysteine methyltransferase
MCAEFDVMRYNETELKQEALRYLGYTTGRVNEKDDNVSQILDKCIRTLAAFTPKYIYKLYNVEHELLIGNDIREHLKNCTAAVFLAATLGSAADKAIRRLEITSLSEALVLDAAANAAIEQVLDSAELEIKHTLNASLTARYSPGYGDFPLEIQEKFLSAIDARRRIGVSVNDNLLLTPCKSVTAVLGVRFLCKNAENTSSPHREKKTDEQIY